MVGFQDLLGAAGVHGQVETFGEFWTDPARRGGDACSSADQQVGQQQDLLIGALAPIVDLSTEPSEEAEDTKLL